MKKPFGFPASMRLKNADMIAWVFEVGTSFSYGPYRLIFLPKKNMNELRLKFGISVPKKSFSSAVTRNRIKRKIKEAFRLHRESSLGNAFLGVGFLIYNSKKEIEDFETPMKDILSQWKEKMEQD